MFPRVVNMKTIIKLFVLSCLVLDYINSSRVNIHDGNEAVAPSVSASSTVVTSKPRPLRGIYRNYKSTFLGNRTVSEYTKQLKTPKTKQKKKTKHSKKSMEAHRYELGQGVNITLDMERDIVNVNLDTNNLKDVILGFWEDGDSGEGRGKKHYEMLHKILPLFVLPFLVQSAIVPFLVSKLKLLLLTSILVGKVAIFLLIISAMKNAPKQHYGHYETGPSYWGAEPSRRTENFYGGGGGYKFDKPSWGN